MDVVVGEGAALLLHAGDEPVHLADVDVVALISEHLGQTLHHLLSLSHLVHAVVAVDVHEFREVERVVVCSRKSVIFDQSVDRLVDQSSDRSIDQ